MIFQPHLLPSPLLRLSLVPPIFRGGSADLFTFGFSTVSLFLSPHQFPKIFKYYVSDIILSKLAN